MAMFVLVVDTSLMNVSISAVVEDLDTTVSGVQSAIALEALVSAAFILISSKVGDLIGRKRAYVLGLLAYAVGALAMTLAQSLTAIIIFWAIIGGLGASLLLPAMQSLIHGNFEGAAQKKAYALVGASAAIAAAIGPLLGGFVTTFLSWRVGFASRSSSSPSCCPASGSSRTCRTPGPRRSTSSAPSSRSSAWAASCSASWSGRRAARSSALLMAVGAVALGSLAWWLVRRKREGKPTLLDPDLFRHPNFRLGISGQMLQNIALGGAMIALPIFLQMIARVQRHADRPLPGAAVADHVRGGDAGREEGRQAAPGAHHPAGFALAAVGIAAIIPLVPRIDSGLVPGHPADRSPAPGSGCSSRSSTTTPSPPSPRSASARPPA